jgi:quercetin dioxygenase-like cupin family protein
VTYFRYAVPFDAAAMEAGTWHWPEVVPPTADVGLLVPPAVPVVPGGDAPVAG